MSQDVDDLWYSMGRNITCRVQVITNTKSYLSDQFHQDEEHVSVTLPSEFVSNIPIKAFTHGFSSRVISDEKTLFVDGNKNIQTLHHALKYFDSLDEFL